jgi:hypothetical protein
MKKTSKKISKSEFELQLAIIGILLTVYWQIFVQLAPMSLGEEFLTFNLVKMISIVIGILWFITLLTGTFSLAFQDDSFYEYFVKLFKVSIVATIALTIFAILVYIIFFIPKIV